MRFGNFTRKLADLSLKSSKCVNCNEYQLTSSVYVNIFFLSFIPFFPTGKKYELKCKNCKKNYSNTERNKLGITKEIIEIEKRYGVKTPFWSYLGSVFIGLVFIFGIFKGISENKFNFSNKEVKPQYKKEKESTYNQFVSIDSLYSKEISSEEKVILFFQHSIHDQNNNIANNIQKELEDNLIESLYGEVSVIIKNQKILLLITFNESNLGNLKAKKELISEAKNTIEKHFNPEETYILVGDRVLNYIDTPKEGLLLVKEDGSNENKAIKLLSKFFEK